MRMKFLWSQSRKLADRWGIDEIRVFVTVNIIVCACLCLLAYSIMACMVQLQGETMSGAGSVSTVLVGIVLGLFISILWMLRNEEEMK